MVRQRLKPWLKNMWSNSARLCKDQILEFARSERFARTTRSMLDLGCDDGAWTMQVAEAFQAERVLGVELVPERAAAAKARGVDVMAFDLNLPFDNLQSTSIDLVHANMVIEHIEKLDNFASEIFRVLKPGAAAIISTENGSSWHNVFAAAMGWQLFSSTNITVKANVGNPMALYRDEAMVAPPSMMHKTIFNYLGFIEFFKAHGFQIISVTGAGYYPLPAFLGAWDVRHSHLMTAHLHKPVSN